MRFTTTDGQARGVADMCAYCNLSTGGQHEVHCPMAEEVWSLSKEERLRQIRDESHRELGPAWERLAQT